jgi:uncharacterized membrane protein
MATAPTTFPARAGRLRATAATVAAAITANRAAAAAVAIGAAGVLYRAVLVAMDVPATNSDEAISGLVAMDIAHGDPLPAYFYGQAYMGALESYLAAPLFAVAGPGLAALRVPLLVMLVLFLVVMYRLAGLLYSPAVGAATVAVLSLPTDRLVTSQLLANGGYPEIVLLAAVLFLITVRLSAGLVRRPTLAFAGWGLAAGVAVWSDPLVLPYVGVAGLLLLVTGRHVLTGARTAALLAGAVVGGAPLIGYNLTARPGTRTVDAVLTMSAADGPWAERLYNALVLGTAEVFGFCSPHACRPGQLVWGPVLLALLVVAGWHAGRGLRRSDRPLRTVHWGRLALVVAAVGSVVAYARSYAAIYDPIGNARYLHCLLVSTPVVVGTVAAASRSGRASRAAAIALTAAAVVGAVWASVTAVAVIPADRDAVRTRSALIATLERDGVTRVYSDYWTCHWLTFLSRERVMCAVLGDDLRPGYDRHPRWAAAVRASADAAYLGQFYTAFDARLRAGLEATGVPVTTLELDGFWLYRPRTPVSFGPGP